MSFKVTAVEKCHKLAGLCSTLVRDQKDHRVSCCQEDTVSVSNNLLRLNLDYLSACGSTKLPGRDGMIRQLMAKLRNRRSYTQTKKGILSQTDKSHRGRHHCVGMQFLSVMPYRRPLQII